MHVVLYKPYGQCVEKQEVTFNVHMVIPHLHCLL